MISVCKQDLINAWSLLEKIAVSIDKIGSAHGTPTKADFTPDRERKMLIEVGRFILDHVADDANRLREPLGDYLPNDEAEALSDQIEYWQPGKH